MVVLPYTVQRSAFVPIHTVPFVQKWRQQFDLSLLSSPAASAKHLSRIAAGYTWDGVIHKMPLKQWTAMLDVHLTAPFRLIQAATPHMRDAAKAEIERHGKAAPRSIINVSSTSGTHGNAGQINYGTVCPAAKLESVNSNCMVVC